jgi:thioesterase domain-containing protein
MRAHEASPCDLPTVFFQASDDASTAPAYGWTSLVPDLIVERVPGKHMDILEPPNVEVLARLVRKHMELIKNAGLPSHPTPVAKHSGNNSVSTPCS